MKFNIDGNSVTLDEEGVKSYVAKLQKQADEAMQEKEEAVKAKEEMDASAEELQSEIEALKAALASKEEELANMMSEEEATQMAKEMGEVNSDAAILKVKVQGDSLEAMQKSVLAAIVPAAQKDSICKLNGDALKTVYNLQVATAKDQAAKMKKGYEGDANLTIAPTGNFANDINAVAAAARKAALDKKGVK